jgi:D-alanyl-D-alanine dipeptidase
MKRSENNMSAGMRRFLFVTLFSLILIPSIFGQEGPPRIPGTREADLIELVSLDSTFKLDVRYAREDNFTGRIVYPEARVFLQRPAAEAVLRVHRKLSSMGYGIMLFDGYRPWSVTKIFWEVTPEDKRMFVANPKNGSKHNRGCAVDLTIYNLSSGRPLPMPSDYDEFTERANPNYAGGTEEERRNRDLLRRLMEEEGFTVNQNEWWHFDFKDWEKYDIYDIPFSKIGK